MRWTWWGAECGLLPRARTLAQFAADFAAARAPLHAAALAIAILAGLATSKWFGARSAWFKLACCAVWYVALNPEVASFVATREALGAKHYLDLDDAFRSIGAGLCVVACATWPAGRDAKVAPTTPHGRERASVALAMLFAALAPAIVSRIALDREPITNDEHAYLFQSRLFARGEIAYDAQGLADFFPARQVAQSEGRLFSKYPPAHSALLSIGERVGFPELLPRLLAMLAIGLTWDLARRLGVAKPAWAAWFLALSPLAIGVESLWLSHTTTIPFCALLVWSAVVAIERQSVAPALLCGFAFSVTLAARPVTAIAVALPIVAMLAIERPKRSLPLLGAAIAGALPGVLWLLWMNRTLTGSPFEFAYQMYAKVASPEDRFGNVTALGAIDNTGFNLARLSTWLAGWSPGLLLVLAATPFRRRWLMVAIPASLVFFYALHPFQGIPWVGPLYLSEGLPALALVCAHGLAQVGARLSRCVWIASIASSALLLHNHFAVARQEIDLRQQAFAPVREAKLDPGVVFVRLTTAWTAKRFPLLPPEPGDELVFALDLGPRNVELMRRLEKARGWSFDPASGQLRPLH